MNTQIKIREIHIVDNLGWNENDNFGFFPENTWKISHQSVAIFQCLYKIIKKCYENRCLPSLSFFVSKMFEQKFHKWRFELKIIKIRTNTQAFYSMATQILKCCRVFYWSKLKIYYKNCFKLIKKRISLLKQSQAKFNFINCYE